MDEETAIAIGRLETLVMSIQRGVVTLQALEKVTDLRIEALERAIKDQPPAAS